MAYLPSDYKNPETGVVSNKVAFSTGATTFAIPRLDRYTNSIQTVDYAHHEIHAGSHFFVVGSQDLPINDVLDFTWVMPDTTKWIHWVWKIKSSSEMMWYVYEGATITNALANTVTPLNSDRNSATASGTVMKYEIQADLAAANVDTDVTAATLIKSGSIGAGRDGGDISRDAEIIMKQNTIYCLRALATAAGTISFDMEWYEHTNIV